MPSKIMLFVGCTALFAAGCGTLPERYIPQAFALLVELDSPVRPEWHPEAVSTGSGR